MNDSDMLDWINEHLSSFTHTLRDEGNEPYDMNWIDDEGEPVITRGENIRHCINNAVKE